MLYIEHGVFRVGLMKRLTAEEFKTRIEARYEKLVVLGEYKTSRTPVLIRCEEISDGKIHGEYETRSSVLLRGRGCFACMRVKQAETLAIHRHHPIPIVVDPGTEPSSPTKAQTVLQAAFRDGGSTRAIINSLKKNEPGVITRLGLLYPDHTSGELKHLAGNWADRPTCPVCSTELRYVDQIRSYPETCSYKCARQYEVGNGKIKDRVLAIQATLVERYGVDNAMKLEINRNKTSATNVERYGTTTFLTTPGMIEQSRLRSKTPEYRNLVRNGIAKKRYGTRDMVEAYQGMVPAGVVVRSITVNSKGLTSRVDFKCSGCGTSTVLSALGLRERMRKFNQVCVKCCPDIRGSSHGEREILGLMNDLGVETIHRHRVDGMEIDLFLPRFNIGIEYTGLYWHSDAIKTDSRHLLNKHQACETHGVRLITIFEDEWQQQRDKVSAVLRHFTGRSERGIYARKAHIEEIDWKRAAPFLDQHHLLGSGTPGKTRVGAFDTDGTLIAVMTFGVPSDERGRTDQVEMKRFVTDGRNHPGLGSRMFKWAIEKFQYERVMAFVDRRWFTGGFKAISGFHSTGITEPSLFYTDGHVRLHRRSYTREELVNTSENPDRADMTKHELMREIGYHRIWDCGKLRLEWTRALETQLPATNLLGKSNGT